MRKQIVVESDKYVNGIFNVNVINDKLDKIYSSL